MKLIFKFYFFLPDQYFCDGCRFNTHAIIDLGCVGINFLKVQMMLQNLTFYSKFRMSVKVAVRVRPFNAREKEIGCKCVVDMVDPTTILKANEKQEEKKFTFDYSFWSFDGFDTDDKGLMKPTGSKYADQKKVYDQLGKKVLDNAYEGYHCCLFAYGQTGSGKSYSMIGFGENKGIVPITCNELFERIKKKKEGEEFEVNASMLEIYNEDVQDLTIDISKRPAGGLKIRESKLLGIYVDGVVKHFVENFQQIQKIMDLGTKNRTIASTQMNATSSRAHTIITIQFKQKKTVGETKTEKISMINLVDLAGSERQAKTGATGQRLKQAVGINLSLTTLGQVISTLAENADGAKKFVPYRNSSLTRILQNALGGNSQTIMICALSPASDNYEETLSTLRYADQAKKIKNQPVVNESDSDKLIRELKAQNQRLKKMLEGKVDPADKVGEKPLSKEQIAANIQNLNKAVEQSTKTKEQKRQDEKKLKEEQKKQASQLHAGEQKILTKADLVKMEKQNKVPPPYLQNVSRDFMLHRKLKIMLEKNKITVGKKGCSPPNQIIFGGRDMKPQHAIIEIDEKGNTSIHPWSGSCHLYVNGEPVAEKTILKDLDRIIFGWNSVYLFRDAQHPRELKKGEKPLKVHKLDWDFCKKEVEKHVDIDQSDTEEDGACCNIF